MSSENTGLEPPLNRSVFSPSCRPQAASRIRLFASTALIGGVLTILMHAPLQAQTWTGAVNTTWGVANNWDNNAVPGAGTTVTINNGAVPNQPIVSTNETVAQTNISGGTLTVDGTLTSPVRLSGTGSMTINVGRSVVGNVIMGSSGALNNNGMIDGSLTVSGGTMNNSGIVTGATTISGGTVNLNAGSNFSNSSPFEVSGGTVNVNTNETIGSLSGTGPFSGVPGGTVNIGAGQTLTINQTQHVVFQGLLAGAGNLTKAGSHNLTLTHTNSMTGAITVNAGILRVNGSVATSSGLTVNNGGAIAGTGTLPATVIASGGTLSPGEIVGTPTTVIFGSSVGTLSINGNLTLNAGATTSIDVQGGTIDRINVTGTANLAGTVRFVALGGTYTFNTPYTFLQAGSITGTFGTKAEQGSFGDGVTTAVTYTATQARLTLTPAALAPIVNGGGTQTQTQQTQSTFGSQTPGSGNQFLVASALDRAVASGANVDAFFNLYNQNRAGILAGLEQLSGVAHTNAPGMAQQASNSFLGAIFNPVAAGRTTPQTAPQTGLVSSFAPISDPSANPGQRAINQAFNFETTSLSKFRPAPKYNLWASILGGAGRIDGETRIGSARQSTGFGGLAAGVDLRIAPETIVGLAVSGATGSSTSARGLGTVKSNQLQLGVYGSTKLGALSLAAGGAWLVGQAEGSRSIPVLGLSNVTSKYDLQGFSGRIEAAWALANIGGITASPFAAFQGSSIRNSAFTERNEATGAAAGLSVSSRTNVTARTELGFKLETIGRIGDMPSTMFVRAGWGHYNTRDASVTGQLVGLSGSQFTVTGARPDRNVLLLTASADVNVTPTVSVGARADAELGSRTRSIGGTGNIKWTF